MKLALVSLIFVFQNRDYRVFGGQTADLQKTAGFVLDELPIVPWIKKV